MDNEAILAPLRAERDRLMAIVAEANGARGRIQQIEAAIRMLDGTKPSNRLGVAHQERRQKFHGKTGSKYILGLVSDAGDQGVRPHDIRAEINMIHSDMSPGFVSMTLSTLARAGQVRHDKATHRYYAIRPALTAVA